MQQMIGPAVFEIPDFISVPIPNVDMASGASGILKNRMLVRLHRAEQRSVFEKVNGMSRRSFTTPRMNETAFIVDQVRRRRRERRKQRVTLGRAVSADAKSDRAFGIGPRAFSVVAAVVVDGIVLVTDIGIVVGGAVVIFTAGRRGEKQR
ncbi:MAG: hypothetical protein M5R36_28720 [Deltaproteobacteria bacterium]|nr:hypothetical protein [Deltaproteobacteria bacterium]